MWWLFLSLAAAVAVSIANILEKHVISDEMRDPLVAVAVTGLSFSLFFALFSVFSSPLSVPVGVAAAAFAAGAVHSTGLFLYYSAARREEISRLIPILRLDTLVVAGLSALLLGESLTPLRYAGMLLLMGGAVLLSLKRTTHMTASLIFMVTLTMLLFAGRSLLLGFAAGQNLYAALSWAGLGGLAVGTLVVARHHPHIRRKARSGIRHLLLANALAIVSFFFFTTALSLAPASLVTAVVSLQVFFVFLIALLLSRTHSRIIREELRGSTLLLKAAAMGLIVAGMVTIV